jgi:Lipid A 3-O-deacylase (PagL)
VRKSGSLTARLHLLPLLLAIVAVLAFSPRARAQDSPLYPPGNEFGMWGGYSVGNSYVFGIEPNRQLGEFALRYARTLYDKPRTSLQYTLDVIPVEAVRQYTYEVCLIAPNKYGYCPNGRETVYGGGVNPLGLKLNFRRARRFQPYIASTAGFVASVRPVPVDIPGGTQFNFTFNFQAGIELFSSPRARSWRLGYQYQHISNAYRKDFNPGVDFHLIYIAYSFFK